LEDGWGLTTDGNLLVASDGSDKIYWLDPNDKFKIVKQRQVLDGTRPVFALNEVGAAEAKRHRSWLADDC
jgi:glutamine cyclotransferase